MATGGPVFEEYRLIYWNGKRILTDRYYPGLGGEETDFSKFDCLSERIDSNFFVADVARTQSGELILIEINDGGAAGLPPDSHPIDFYAPVAREAGMDIPEEADW